MSGDKAGNILSAQREELRTFGKLMNSRASEYVELASTLSDLSRKATDDAAAQVREVADVVAEQTKRAADNAAVYKAAFKKRR